MKYLSDIYMPSLLLTGAKSIQSYDCLLEKYEQFYSITKWYNIIMRIAC